MSTWILADTHLDHTGEKPMSIFGPVWNNHEEVLAENWNRLITADDTVIIAGDISWAMSALDAVEDLRFLDNLPGKRKIFLKGNHDFWWSTRSKVERLFADNELDTLEIMQNEAVLIKASSEAEKDFLLIGTRGWKLPSDSDANAKDKKVYEREKQRLKMSLDDAKKLIEREGLPQDIEKIAISHFPPLNKHGDDSEITDILENAGIKRAFYGHVHKQYGNPAKLCFEGEKNGILFKNIALDYIECVPVRIESKQ